MKLCLEDRVVDRLATFFDLTGELHFPFTRQEAHRAHPIEIGLHRLRAQDVGLLGRLGGATAIPAPVLALLDRDLDAGCLEPPKELPNVPLAWLPSPR